MDGIRDSKTVKTLQNGTVTESVRHDYTTLGGKLVREAYGQTVIDYFYDQDGRPYKIVVKNDNATVATGYFVLNLQGDVIAIVDSNGAVAVEYEYDAWGKEIYHDTHADQGNILYQYNALKYRGYYYDSDLGLYYLNNRFYDQEIGRFINADTVDLVLAFQITLTDKNLYAYCDNNPVVRRDESGAIWETAFDVISLAASIAEVAADPTDVWAWAGLVGDAIDLIPIVTGAGETIRGLKIVGDATSDLKRFITKSLDAISEAATNLKKGCNTVYVSYSNDIIEYVGITNDFKRRKDEWDGIRKIEKYVWDLDRDSARYVEQAVIDTFGMKKNGGLLSNKINSIGKKNPKYKGYLNFYNSIK